jgi:hypothetical protein
MCETHHHGGDQVHVDQEKVLVMEDDDVVQVVREDSDSYPDRNSRKLIDVRWKRQPYVVSDGLDAKGEDGLTTRHESDRRAI